MSPELLEGADPGARDEDMETPLMVAARLGSLEICRDLVAAGAQAADRDSNDWLAAGAPPLRPRSFLVNPYPPAHLP